MYLRPELKVPYARFWEGIAGALCELGIEAPETLTITRDLDKLWLDPNLLLSQTCGMPFRTFLRGRVTYVATPDYGHPNCPPGYYRSAMIVRMDDPREALKEFANARFAYNETTSQSGYAAPLTHARTTGVCFANTVASGGHIKSAQMVAEGAADIAALDALSWRHMQRFDAWARRLRVLVWTVPATPVLPFITSKGRDTRPLFEALERGLMGLSDADRDTLGIQRILHLTTAEYYTVDNV